VRLPALVRSDLPRLWVWARFLRPWALCLALAACTLTEDDFQPALVGEAANLPPDAGAAPALLGGCPDQSECCTDVTCPAGQSCTNGRCVLVDAGASAGCGGSECTVPVQLEQPPDASSSAPDFASRADGGSPPAAGAATCNDRVLNQNESDVDCGGRCAPCNDGQSCRTDDDCAAGFFCPSASGRCTAASCTDGVRNGSEGGVDCGGGCAGCADGANCAVNRDCASGVCAAGRCAAPTCFDNVENGTETDVDCGGTCNRNCGNGAGCASAADCQSGVCAAQGCARGVAQCCQAPSCSDGVTNGGESAVDCGTAACGACPLGSTCLLNVQCQTNFCQLGRCAVSSCTDRIQNGAETGVDCGGGSCPRCADRSACLQPADCINNNCFNGVCISCGDGVLDGSETDVDCGGTDPACQRCRDRLRCSQASDCANNNCLNGICISCGDGVIDGTETDFDCGGSDPACRRCSSGQRCLNNTDCLSGFCNNGFC
jgi:hypothetical protein